MPADVHYLELGDFLLIAEAVTGIRAEVLGRSERVISQADKRTAFICMVEFIERNGNLLELGPGDTAERVDCQREP